jgi:hypothetical protein
MSWAEWKSLPSSPTASMMTSQAWATIACLHHIMSRAIEYSTQCPCISPHEECEHAVNHTLPPRAVLQHLGSDDGWLATPASMSLPCERGTIARGPLQLAIHIANQPMDQAHHIHHQYGQRGGAAMAIIHTHRRN